MLTVIENHELRHLLVFPDFAHKDVCWMRVAVHKLMHKDLRAKCLGDESCDV